MLHQYFWRHLAAKVEIEISAQVEIYDFGPWPQRLPQDVSVALGQAPSTLQLHRMKSSKAAVPVAFRGKV